MRMMMITTSWRNNSALLLLSVSLLLVGKKTALAFSSIATPTPRRYHAVIPTANNRDTSTTRLFSTTFNTSLEVVEIMASTMKSSSVTSGPPLPPVPSNAKRLFLVRHGEVVNPGGDRPVYYGALDVPLSPLGEAEARAAADYLSQFDLAHVFCSPLQRAVYGAQQVMLKQQVVEKSSSSTADVIILDGFTELDRGAWCGLTKAEIGPENLARFDACDESITPDGGESYPFLKSRVLAALGTCSKESSGGGAKNVLGSMQPGESAAIVSHLQVTRSILSQALDIPTSEMAAKLPIKTASVTCVDYATDEKTGDHVMTVHYQSFKPEAGLAEAKDGAN